MRPLYCVLPVACTVSRPRTMSSGYVALMAMMPAPAPATRRRNGVSCPLPVSASLRSEIALWKPRGVPSVGFVNSKLLWE